MVVEYPRACNNFAKEAEIIPLPSEDVTPPVTNTYFVEFDMYFLNVTTGRKVSRFIQLSTRISGIELK
jgi:hypothetical protein